MSGIDKQQKPEAWDQACAGEVPAMAQLVGALLRVRDFAAALFWSKELMRQARGGQTVRSCDEIRKDLHRGLWPDQLKQQPASGPAEWINVSRGWVWDRPWDARDQGLILEPDEDELPTRRHRSATVCAVPLGAGIYRISLPPRHAAGLSFGDIVAVTAAYEGKLYVADIVGKSGCRTLWVRPDHPYAHFGELAKILIEAGAGLMEDFRNSECIGVNVPPEFRLDKVARILSDWEWDVAWQYLDPTLDAETARRVDLPVPAPRPFPPDAEEQSDWPDHVDMLLFREAAEIPGGRAASHYVFAEQRGPAEYQIMFPERKQKGVSIGDRYEATPRSTGWPEARRLIERSGNRTVWLNIVGPRTRSNPILVLLAQLGCTLCAATDGASSKEICVSVPSGTNLDEVIEILETAKASGALHGWQLTDIGRPFTPAELAEEAEQEAFVLANSSELVKVCNKIMVEAWNRGASAVYVAHGRTTLVEFETGVQRETYVDIAAGRARAITMRYKIMCSAQPGVELRAIKSGVIRLRDHCEIDAEARVEFVPAETGVDDVVLRFSR